MTSSDASLLSTKPIPRRERLIVALDVDTHDAALDLVRELGDAVWFYKIGLQLFLAANHLDLIKRLRGLGKRVFADLKLFDVPETVASAVRQLASSGAEFATIHGQDAMLRAACEQDRGALKLLAVTVLTSIDQGDLQSLGFGTVDVEELVLSRARRALALGCDGVISSGLEARRLRGELGERFLIVSPGIRPLENRLADDQKRVMSVEGAFASGADHIVVGRPIRKAADPRAYWSSETQAKELALIEQLQGAKSGKPEAAAESESTAEEKEDAEPAGPGHASCRSRAGVMRSIPSSAVGDSGCTAASRTAAMPRHIASSSSSSPSPLTAEICTNGSRFLRT